MSLLAGGITHGQAVALILLCVFLIIFVVLDVCLLLFLRRKNKKLANDADNSTDIEGDDEGTNISLNE